MTLSFDLRFFRRIDDKKAEIQHPAVNGSRFNEPLSTCSSRAAPRIRSDALSIV